MLDRPKREISEDGFKAEEWPFWSALLLSSLMTLANLSEGLLLLLLLWLNIIKCGYITFIKSCFKGQTLFKKVLVFSFPCAGLFLYASLPPIIIIILHSGWVWNPNAQHNVFWWNQLQCIIFSLKPGLCRPNNLGRPRLCSNLRVSPARTNHKWLNAHANWKEVLSNETVVSTK